MLHLLDAARQSYNDMLRTTCWGQECAAQPRCIDFFAKSCAWMDAAEAVQRHEQTRASVQSLAGLEPARAAHMRFKDLVSLLFYLPAIPRLQRDLLRTCLQFGGMGRAHATLRGDAVWHFSSPVPQCQDGLGTASRRSGVADPH